MTDGERLEEIVEAEVARGDARGVVTAAGRGDGAEIAAAGGRRWRTIVAPSVAIRSRRAASRRHTPARRCCS
jgi:hypothetical protein